MEYKLRIMKVYIITIIILITGLLPHASHSQAKSYTFEQLDSLQSIDRRNVIVFIHTDWCRYCQAMKKTTFTSPEVVKMLNEHYWFIALNAEEKRTIHFNGQAYYFKPTGNNIGIHGLAEHLGSIDGKVSFPTTCFLSPDYNVLIRYDQFITASNFLKLTKEINRIRR